jgi:hypothetical protein
VEAPFHFEVAVGCDAGFEFLDKGRETGLLEGFDVATEEEVSPLVLWFGGVEGEGGDEPSELGVEMLVMCSC